MKEYKIKLELTGNFEDDWNEKKIKSFLKFILEKHDELSEIKITEVKETNTDNPYHIDHKRQTKLF